MKKLFFTLILLFVTGYVFSQTHHNFEADEWVGIWRGNLIISYPSSTSSVPMKLEISKTGKENEYKWVTTYGEGEKVMSKDYILYAKNIYKGAWVLDENNSILIDFYFTNNKFYSVFETQNSLLCSMYKLENGKLFFEITSSKSDEPNITGNKDDEKSKVKSYPVFVTQSAELSR